MLPTSYPNNYLLNAIDIGLTGKVGYTSDKTISSSNELVHKKYTDDGLNSKLSLTGGTLTGAIDMTDKKITTSYVPIHNHDLCNKEYIDGVIPNVDDFYTKAETYSKTEADDLFRTNTDEITYLSNGTYDGVYLTPSLVNVKLGTNVPYF
jgi:hypothetical protein